MHIMTQLFWPLHIVTIAVKLVEAARDVILVVVVVFSTNCSFSANHSFSHGKVIAG